ncbi:hypothetical protein D3C77_315940 [compost metagenome]
MSVILVLTGFLAHPVEALTQAVALGQKQFALFGVLGHQIEGLLQLQARFTEILAFEGALFQQFGQFFFQTPTAQAQLLGARLAGRQPSVEFTLLAGLVLGTTTQLFAVLLKALLLFALLLQPGFKQFERGLQLLVLKPQALQFLAPGQQPTLSIAGAIDPQKMPPDPVAITADQTLTVIQAAALGQRLLKAFHRQNLPQPGRQIDPAFNLVEQAARNARTFGR